MTIEGFFAEYPQGSRLFKALSLGFREQCASPRWKEVVQPAPGRWMHHLELWSPDEIDDEVRGWIRDAWNSTG